MLFGLQTKMNIFVAVALAVLALPSASGHAIPQNCSARYQAALREALDVREECGDAAAYDCCQIMNTAGLVNTVDQLYEIKSGVNAIGQVCNENEDPFLVHDSHGEMKARCDMETEEGGWLVIQRRVSGGTENFVRGWTDYENGFGDLNGEFWYGLKNIHCLTARDDVELRIDLKQDDGTKATWTYQLFKVAGQSDNYRVTIGQGEGTTFDFMAYHNNMQFTTFDRDNDEHGSNCAEVYKGGWWYNACYRSKFNGLHESSNLYQRIITYNQGTGTFLVYQDVDMKIRPKSCLRQKQTKCK